MRKDCDTCLHDEFCETYCNDCYWANGKPPTKWEPAPFWTPDTNADRIRAMSDEEIAQWLCLNYSCTKCLGQELCTISDGKANGLLKWLKQPADMRGE